MAHIEFLIQYLLPLHQVGVTKFIAICGAADLGKSTLCTDLTERLIGRKISADVLHMDSYLIPRTQRNSLDISGYDPRAYQWDRLMYHLSMLQLGTSVQIRDYNHQDGLANGPWRDIKPGGLILIDGLHSMHLKVKPYLDSSVFIVTSNQQLKQLRLKGDIKKRGLSEKAAMNNSELEFSRYQIHIAPYQKDAKLLLSLNEKWQYKLSLQRG